MKKLLGFLLRVVLRCNRGSDGRTGLHSHHLGWSLSHAASPEIRAIQEMYNSLKRSESEGKPIDEKELQQILREWYEESIVPGLKAIETDKASSMCVVAEYWRWRQSMHLLLIDTASAKEALLQLELEFPNVTLFNSPSLLPETSRRRGRLAAPLPSPPSDSAQVGRAVEQH